MVCAREKERRESTFQIYHNLNLNHVPRAIAAVLNLRPFFLPAPLVNLVANICARLLHGARSQSVFSLIFFID